MNCSGTALDYRSVITDLAVAAELSYRITVARLHIQESNHNKEGTNFTVADFPDL